MIIGTGAGRTGTKSLATLLDAQTFVRRTTHESCDPFSTGIQQAVDALRVRNDVSHAHMRYIDELLERLPAARLVWMRRDNRGGHRLSLYRAKEYLRPADPFTTSGSYQTVDEYLTETDRLMKRLQSRHGHRMHVMETEELNTIRGQLKLAEFLKVVRWRFVAVHKHPGKPVR